MPDEVAATAAYGSKMNPSIVESRLNAQGGIIAVNYGAAADELTGYETALKESLSTITPAPTVTEVRYFQEYQRETARALKKYGGGVAVREAAAIARLWCGSEFGAPYGRGLPYSTLSKIAYDLFGLTLPSAQTYQMQSIRREENYDTEEITWTANGSGNTTRSKWSETYGIQTHENAWIRATVDASHVGTGKEFWLRWTPSAKLQDNPLFDGCQIRILPAASHHAAGLESSEACYLSLFGSQGSIGFDLSTLAVGTPRVEHFTGIEIPSDHVIEAALTVDDDWNIDYDNENRFSLAATWEILWAAP